MRRFSLTLLGACIALPLSAAETKRPTPAEIIKQSPASDWRALDPDNTVLMNVNGTEVIMELAPRFAPRHAANIRTLTREGYFDGLAVIRVQDNFVSQWGDPADDDESKTPAKTLGSADKKIPAEFSIAYKGLPISKLGDVDGFAPVSGFVDGFPVAADPKRNRAWIAHCYGVVGAGRGNTVDSSTGASLYAIIGHAPRTLDLNITVVGRVIKGMEALSALPRGTGAMGFYEKPEQYVPIKQARLLSQLPEAERPALEVLRTESKTWQQLVDARRRGTSDWYVYSAGHTNICNMTVPTRPKAATPAG